MVVDFNRRKKMSTKIDKTRDLLDKLRLLNENADEKGNNNLITNDAIAITDDPRFGQNVLTNQIQQFRSAVESGAEFSKVEGNNVSECPMIYLPEKKNLIFSGVIPCLNNLKFQFVLKTNTGKGCFVWADGLILSEDNMAILSKLYGFYANWREQWNTEGADLEKMANALKDI